MLILDKSMDQIEHDITARFESVIILPVFVGKRVLGDIPMPTCVLVYVGVTKMTALTTQHELTMQDREAILTRVAALLDI